MRERELNQKDMLGVDKSLTEYDMRRILQEKVDASSQADVSRALKVSRTYLSDVLSGKRHVSKRVAEYLGYELRVETIRIYQVFRQF